MAANALTLPLATDIVGRLEKRLLSSLESFVEEWSESAAALTRWEDEHLLERPSGDLMLRHKTTVGQLIRLGKLLSALTADPAFPNDQQHSVVVATLQMLEDKLAMWHGKMSESERQKIMAACFA